MRQQLRAIRFVLALSWAVSPVRLVAFALTTTGLYLGMPLSALAVKLGIDGVLSHDEREAIVAAAFLATIQGGMWVAWRLGGVTLRSRLYDLIRMNLSRRLIALAAAAPTLELFESPRTSARLQQLREDVWQLEEPLDGIFFVFRQLVYAAASSVLLVRVHPALLLVAALSIPTLLVAGRADAAVRIAEDETAAHLRLARRFRELAVRPGPAKETRSFGTGRELRRRQFELLRRVYRTRDRAQLRSLLIGGAAWIAFACGYSGAVLFVVLRALNGQATVGDVVLTMAVAGNVNDAIGGLLWSYAQMARSLRAVSRYLGLLDGVQEPGSGGEAPAERLSTGIRLEGVTFAYESGPEALSGVDLDLPAGSIVALVGDNGAGKTSLVKLLCGLHKPAVGHVLVEGRDLVRLDVEAWRRRITAAFQDYARLQLTLREAVGSGRLNAIDDDDAVRSALNAAGAGELEGRLPGGLDTRLGRRLGGQELSGGQWQKVAVARGLIRRDPLLVVLDEPTSALDAHAEEQLFRAYAGTARALATRYGTITILVSHRFSTVSMADLIVVLERGRVVEVGSHEELLTAGGTYGRLYRIQEAAYR